MVNPRDIAGNAEDQEVTCRLAQGAISESAAF